MTVSPRSYRRSTVGVLLVVLITTAFATSGCSPKSDASEAKTGDQGTKALPVETLKIATSEFREVFDVPGLTEASAHVRVSFESSGRIVRLTVDEGDRVERGQLIAQVETDVDRARINLLQNQVDSAEREYERTKKLVDEGIATDQQLDQTESSLENARLNLQQARVALRRSTIVSPVAGEIATKHAEQGEFASPGLPLVDIIDGRGIEVTTSVPASRTTNLAKGDEVDVDIPAFNRRVSGRIVRIPSAVNNKTRTLEVTLRLDKQSEAHEHPLRPGMRATAHFVEKIWKDAVLIPRTAVLQGFNRDEVALYQEAGGDDGPATAKIQPVTLGPGARNRVVITEGLEAGDILITRGHRGVTDGAPVNSVRRYDGLSELPN